MSKYGLQASLKATPGMGKELLEILLAAANLMQKADGCHLYAVGLDQADKDAVSIMELWDNKEAHDASLAIDGVRELIGQAMPLLAGPPARGIEIEVFGGVGVPS